MPTHRTRLIVKTAILTLLGAGALAAAIGLTVYKAGWYNIGATATHLQPVYRFLELAMHNSVRHHAQDIVVPKLGAHDQVLRGGALYSTHCAQCHGGPGVAPEPRGQAMQPVPGPLVAAVERWKPREMYWITRHGIKMSGMPAWEAHLDEADTWAVVAFLTVLPGLNVSQYQAMTAAPLAPATDQASPAAPTGTASGARPGGLRGDPQRGKRILRQYACHSCHMVPGVTGSEVDVARPLTDLARRPVIAGRLAPTQENLIRWIRDPQAIDPRTAMPDMGVTQRDAVDISAYLLGQ